MELPDRLIAGKGGVLPQSATPAPKEPELISDSEVGLVGLPTAPPPPSYFGPAEQRRLDDLDPQPRAREYVETVLKSHFDHEIRAACTTVRLMEANGTTPLHLGWFAEEMGIGLPENSGCLREVFEILEEMCKEEKLSPKRRW